LLLPLALVIFNFSLAESSLWAMASLSNIAVLAFAAWAVACIGAESDRHKLVLAMLLAVMASISQANGVFVPLVCILYLAANRRWHALLAFLPVMVVCGMFFRWAHAAQALGAVVLGDPLYALKHPLDAFVYFLTFLGSVIGSLVWAPVLGAVMMTGWLFVLYKDKRLWRSPANALMVFLLITGAAVTLGRLSLGMLGANASRYSMNSVLFIALLVGMLWPWLRGRMQMWAVALIAMLANGATFYAVRPAIYADIAHKEELFAAIPHCEQHHADYPEPLHAEMVIRKSLRYGLYPFPVEKTPQGCPVHVRALVAPELSKVSGVKEGYLDTIKPAGNMLFLGGWWLVPDTEWGVSMIVATPIPAKRIVISKVARPDLVKQFGDAGYLHSGFGLALEFENAAQSQAVAKEVCLAYQSTERFEQILPVMHQPNDCRQFVK